MRHRFALPFLRRAGLLLSLAIIVLACQGGCASYHLGTTGRLAFSTLYVAPVENKTLLPQAQAILTTRVREVLLRDGRITLANTPETADATLRVVIHDYYRSVEAVRSGDTGLARKFALNLAVTCQLRDNRSGKVLFSDRTLAVRRDAFTDSGQLQSEYQALPLLAESLADKVAHAVLDVW